MAQASALRRVLLGSVLEQLEVNVPEIIFGDLSAFPGEELTPFFLDRTSKLFETLNQGS